MIATQLSYRTLSAAVALSLCVFSATNGRLFAGTLNADQVPNITVMVQGASTDWMYTPPAAAYTAASDGGYQLSSAQDYYGVCDNKANVKVDKLQFNSDPFVLNNILVTNTTAANQIFSVTVGLPVAAFPAPNSISGNVTTSVIDGDASGGATVSTVSGQPIYMAQIDFADVQALQSAPFSVSTPGSGSASASFGPIVSGIPVTSNIGIKLTFQLTPGDTAAILSRFDVNAVPEPASIVLCAFVALMTIGRRNRKQN